GRCLQPAEPVVTTPPSPLRRSVNQWRLRHPRRRRRHYTNAAIVILCLCVRCFAADAFKPGLEGKKLISYGADWPNTQYVKRNIRAMETHPFDGVVIGAGESREPQLNGPTLGIKAWGKQKFDAKDYQHCIEDLKATKFE